MIGEPGLISIEHFSATVERLLLECTSLELLGWGLGEDILELLLAGGERVKSVVLGDVNPRLLSGLSAGKVRRLGIPRDQVAQGILLFRGAHSKALLTSPTLTQNHELAICPVVLTLATSELEEIEHVLEVYRGHSKIATSSLPTPSQRTSLYTRATGPLSLHSSPDECMQLLHNSLREAPERQVRLLRNGVHTEVSGFPELTLWCAAEVDDFRWRLRLGTSSPETDRPWSFGHTLEILRKGDRKGNALFAQDQEDGTCYLVFRGALRGHGHGSFWTYSRCQAADLGVGETQRVALVTPLGSTLTVPYLAAFTRDLDRVCSCLARQEDQEEEELVPFLELDADERVFLVHGLLLGQGELERETAVRFVAQELRNEGLANFQRLHPSGPLYEAIEHCFRSKSRFSLTRKTAWARLEWAEDYEGDDWINCILQALGTDVLERDELLRRAHRWAKDKLGLRTAFIKSVQQELSSALKRCARRKLVESVGKNGYRQS